MVLRRLLAGAGVAVIKQSTLERLVSNERILHRNAQFHEFAQYINSKLLSSAIALLPFSRGEIFQDIFAALILQDVEKGFCVEFGATNGIDGNNTWLFETHLGWKCLLSEPARGWQHCLRRNRRAAISDKCVWSESGTFIEFTEAQDGGLSTISRYASADRHADRRTLGKTYQVQTVSLNDLLKEHDAPAHIDFMSVDTEGSEYEIPAALDFEKYSFGVLTVEHNFRADRENIQELLVRHGYLRAPIELSKFDDWYVSSSLSSQLAYILRSSVAENPLNEGIQGAEVA